MAEEEIKKQEIREEDKVVATVTSEGEARHWKGQEAQEDPQKKSRSKQRSMLGILLLIIVAAIYLFGTGERQEADTHTSILIPEGSNPPSLVATKAPASAKPPETFPAVSPTVAPTPPPPPKSPLEQASEKLDGYEIPYYKGVTRFIFTVRPENIKKLEKSTNGYSTWTATVRGVSTDGMPIIWLLFLDDEFGVVDKAKMTESN